MFNFNSIHFMTFPASADKVSLFSHKNEHVKQAEPKRQNGGG